MVLTDLYKDSSLIKDILEHLGTTKARVHVDGLTGSLPAVAIAALAMQRPTVNQLVIAPSKEEAYYLQNDIEALLNVECGMMNDERSESANSSFITHHSSLSVMLFPTSYRKAYHYDPEQTENANLLMRTEVVKALGGSEPVIVVSYPDALSEKVVSSNTFRANTFRISARQQDGHVGPRGEAGGPGLRARGLRRRPRPVRRARRHRRRLLLRLRPALPHRVLRRRGRLPPHLRHRQPAQRQADGPHRHRTRILREFASNPEAPQLRNSANSGLPDGVFRQRRYRLDSEPDDGSRADGEISGRHPQGLRRAAWPTRNTPSPAPCPSPRR